MRPRRFILIGMVSLSMVAAAQESGRPGRSDRASRPITEDARRAGRSPSAGETPALQETIEVNLVNLDVFVTDKSGARIRNLTKNDFEVFENGVKQIISNFIEYSDGRLVDTQPS